MFRAITVIAALVGFSKAAEAGCPAAPTNYNAEDCVVGGVALCDLTGSDYICDVTVGGGSNNASVFGYTDTVGGTMTYFIWGAASDGTSLYCCDTQAIAGTTLVIVGGPAADTIDLIPGS